MTVKETKKEIRQLYFDFGLRGWLPTLKDCRTKDELYQSITGDLTILESAVERLRRLIEKIENEIN